MVLAFFRRKKKRHMILLTIIAMMTLHVQSDTSVMKEGRDSVQMQARASVSSSGFPRPIPYLLEPDWFIPKDRLLGYEPWTYAPMSRPVFPVIKIYGFDGSIGFGEYSLQHPEKFFSTLEGYNRIDIPQYFVSEQMMLGNTLKLGHNFYFLSGILYGARLGTDGNNWGMGTREGFIWHPTPLVSITFWTQYFQSVEVYSPVIFPRPDRPLDSAAILMPATPEVFSFGLQASFVAGEFVIGIGTSVAPVPFQKRHHSAFRYK